MLGLHSIGGIRLASLLSFAGELLPQFTMSIAVLYAAALLGSTRYTRAGSRGIARPPPPSPPPAPLLCVSYGGGLPLTDTGNVFSDDGIEAYVVIIEAPFDELKEVVRSGLDAPPGLYELTGRASISSMLVGKFKFEISQRGPRFDHCVYSHATTWR